MKKWHVSRAGWGRGGLYLARLFGNDGQSAASLAPRREKN